MFVDFNFIHIHKEMNEITVHDTYLDGRFKFIIQDTLCSILYTRTPDFIFYRHILSWKRIRQICLGLVYLISVLCHLMK